MFNMNRVTLLGRAGGDPEIRTMRNGGTIAKFTLATTEKWRKDGGNCSKPPSGTGSSCSAPPPRRP